MVHYLLIRFMLITHKAFGNLISLTQYMFDNLFVLIYLKDFYSLNMLNICQPNLPLCIHHKVYHYLLDLYRRINLLNKRYEPFDHLLNVLVADVIDALEMDVAVEFSVNLHQVLLTHGISFLKPCQLCIVLNHVCDSREQTTR